VAAKESLGVFERVVQALGFCSSATDCKVKPVNNRRLAMSNPMKYIKDLEAAGFQRNQAEAQVQMVLDAIEGDLVTKSDFAIFREYIDGRFVDIGHRFNEVEHRFKKSSFAW
jgi:hypothetical protein